MYIAIVSILKKGSPEELCFCVCYAVCVYACTHPCVHMCEYTLSTCKGETGTSALYFEVFSFIGTQSSLAQLVYIASMIKVVSASAFSHAILCIDFGNTNSGPHVFA